MNQASPDLPVCPSCAQPMALARIWLCVGELPVRHTFRCARCEVVFTEVATGDGGRERAIDLQFEVHPVVQ